ncbi:MAG: KamA family radical SAM protein, partial [Spirochaetales bacterium]|nr:KamA family radical SAM protein [Spirochaetales bacterium]
MITKKEQLIALLNLTEEEKRFYDTEEGMLPLKIPAHYASLIDPDNPNDPLRRQVVPSSEELKIDERTTLDPLAEEEYGVTDRLIHRYPNRVAFLTTDICAIHCRHCFRRRFTATDQGPATSDQIKEAAAYVAEHPQVKEILFTGGDVLTLS